MSPSYAVKNGVRYRFYVSSAVLRGRKSAAGSVTRVSAEAIETAVADAVVARASELLDQSASTQQALDLVHQVTIRCDRLTVAMHFSSDIQSEHEFRTFDVAWSKPAQGNAETVEFSDTEMSKHKEQLTLLIVRAQAWVTQLRDGRVGSIEALAVSAGLHPKVVRQQIQFAFLGPRVISNALSS
jgi:hypothetical protein